MSEPGFPDEPKSKWVDLFGIDPDYGDTTEAAEREAEIANATRLGFELGKAEGRKQALEEAVAKANWLAEGVANPEKPYNEAFIHACGVVARHIEDMASQPQEATSEPLTATTGHPDLPEDGEGL